MSIKVSDYPGTRAVLSDDDYFDISITDNAGVDYLESEKAKFSVIKSQILGEFDNIAGLTTETLRHNGTKWITNNILTNDGTTVRVNGDFTGSSGGVSFGIVNASGTEWALKNLSTGHIHLPQGGFSIFCTSLSEHTFIQDLTGQTLLGAYDRITTNNLPGGMLDIIGETDTSAKDAVIIRNHTRTAFARFRNDSRFIYTDGNEAAGFVLTSDVNGVATWQAAGGGGETNTASNQGVGGIGFFDLKSGVDLQFRNAISQNTLLNIALDAPNKEVEFTVQTNLSNYTNDSGWTTNLGTVTSVGGGTALTSTGGTTPSLSLDNTAVTPGAYTSADITVDAQGRLTAVASGAGGGSLWTDDGGGNISYSLGEVRINGVGATSTTSSLVVKNSAADLLMEIIDNGDMKIGLNAGVSATNTANGSIWIGENSGKAFSGGGRVVLVGESAGEDIGASGNLTYIGNFAGANTTVATHNTFVGDTAGLNLTTGSRNSFFGSRAGLAGTAAAGVDNIAIGYNSFPNFTTADRCTIIGSGAGSLINVGDRNIAIGTASMASLKSGTDNVAIGESAGEGSGTTGTWTDCVFLGGAAGNKVDTALNCVGIGSSALQEVTTGGNNIAIGFNTAANLTTGTDNVIIGHNLAASGVGVSDELNIANIYKGDISTGVAILPVFTIATLPTVVSGGFIMISDETGGYVSAFSDGTNWRRTTDRAIAA